MPAVREPPPLPLSRSLSEADLSHLWEGQRFPAAALRTQVGEQLRVVYRGRRNAGAGPDFRDAILAGAAGLLEGDVELHVRTSDFRRHGHHADPAYDGLALHVVFRHDEAGATRLACGREVPVVALADWHEERTREIESWLAWPVQWQEPCRSAVERLRGPVVGETLDRLGLMRFRQLTAAWAKRLRGDDAAQLLWAGLLEALGYGGQREAFRALAGAVRWRAVLEALAPVAARERAPVAEGMLLAAADALGSLRGERGRPGNRPAERLRGAARLAARLVGLGPEALIALAGGGADAAPGLWRALTVPGAVGRGRAVEMAANVVLPLAAAWDARLAGPAEAAYARLPLPARYGAVRHLHEALGGAVSGSARRQQGMLYLLKQYCTQGGCGRCPLS